MTDLERQYAYGTWAMVETPMCATCAHYRQHYTEAGGIFHPVNMGHCTYPQCKTRLPYNLCEYYTPVEGLQDKLYYPRGYNDTRRSKEANP